MGSASSSTNVVAATSIPPVANSREPKRSDRYPETGPASRNPALSGSMEMPAHSGVDSNEYPCEGSQSPCSQMISMNIRPPLATAARNVDREPNANARMANSEIRNIGLATRVSTARNATRQAAPLASAAITNGLCQPRLPPAYGWMPYVTPIITRTMPTANSRLPAQSIGAGVRTPRSCRLRYAQTVPNRPNGTDTRNTSRQLIGASTPPSTSPMNMPLMPATLMMPIHRPRSRARNASVRTAAQLETRQAAPTPWTTRMTSSHVAPGRPVIQSMVSSSDAAVYTTNPRL